MAELLLIAFGNFGARNLGEGFLPTYLPAYLDAATLGICARRDRLLGLEFVLGKGLACLSLVGSSVVFGSCSSGSWGWLI